MMNLDDTLDTAADTLRFSLVGMDADTLEAGCDDAADTADTLRFSLVGMDADTLEAGCDDAADTLRFSRIDLLDPDTTSIYDIRAQSEVLARRRQIRSTEQLIEGLRNAIAEGWNVGPELVYAERQLAQLRVGR